MQTNTSPPVWVSAVPAILMLVLFFGVLVFMVFLWGSIFRKAGYSFWMALLMFVPIANIVWMVVFAFSKWPVLRELEAYRAERQGYVPGTFQPTMPAPPPPPAQL